MKITPVILCGGSGTRLWPLSRQNHPKQFLELVGDSTLFQQSLSRVIALENEEIQIEEIIIVTNEHHRFLVLEQLVEIREKLPIRILLEPEPKNTAPALTLAALAGKETNPDSILVVTPADHYVKNLKRYVKAIHTAIKRANDNTILTIGIKPKSPDSGFGYIHYKNNGQVKDVLSFKEKPSLNAAKQMIGQGRHAWNAGIFVLKLNTWLSKISKSNKYIYKHIKTSWHKKIIDPWFERPEKIFFTKSPSDSIDYAVMEKAKELEINIKLILLNAGWSDLGSFRALEEIQKKDLDKNIFKGDVVYLNTKNTTAISTKKNITLNGVENLIIIETTDSVFISSKNDIHMMKEVVGLLEKNHYNLLSEHRRVLRPWGWYEVVDEGKGFKVKKIQVNPGARLSYQSHKFRNEHWVVVRGKASVISNGKDFHLNENESTYIKKGIKHQLINNNKNILEIIEIQTGKTLIEDDIKRFNDIYGRNKKN